MKGRETYSIFEDSYTQQRKEFEFLSEVRQVLLKIDPPVLSVDRALNNGECLSQVKRFILDGSIDHVLVSVENMIVDFRPELYNITLVVRDDGYVDNLLSKWADLLRVIPEYSSSYSWWDRMLGRPKPPYIGLASYKIDTNTVLGVWPQSRYMNPDSPNLINWDLVYDARV